MFPVFGAVILASIALVGAWFVHLSAIAQAGRLRTVGRFLAGWLVILAVLTVMGGAFAAGHQRHPGFSPRGETVRMHGGPGRLGRGPGERPGWRSAPPSAATPAAPATPAPASPARPS